jgi:transcriptional regulator with XRE-family HTH domain
VTREQVAAQRTELGKRLARHRERHALSQKEFAERVFYDRTSITKIEAGRQSAPQAFLV